MVQKTSAEPFLVSVDRGSGSLTISYWVLKVQISGIFLLHNTISFEIMNWCLKCRTNVNLRIEILFYSEDILWLTLTSDLVVKGEREYTVITEITEINIVCHCISDERN